MKAIPGIPSITVFPLKASGKLCSWVCSGGLSAPLYRFKWSKKNPNQQKTQPNKTTPRISFSHVRGALRQMKADPTECPCLGEHHWLLSSGRGSVFYSLLYLHNTTKVLLTLITYFPQSREKHWKNWRSSENTGIWNKYLAVPRVSLQEVMGYKGGTSHSCFLGLTHKRHHGNLHLSCLVSILKSILNLYLISYTSIASLYLIVLCEE